MTIKTRKTAQMHDRIRVSFAEPQQAKKHQQQYRSTKDTLEMKMKQNS